MKLFLPGVRAPVSKPPSFVKLDLAFGVGAGASLFDKSRYRSHGTISGADWATGLHGKCLDFDAAVPDYVEIPAAHTQLDFTSEDFSIIARVYADAYPNDLFIFNRGAASVDGYDFRILADGRLVVRTSQSGVDQYSYSTLADIATTTWYTVGMSRDGATVNLYVNGVDTVSIAGTHKNPVTCARTAKIGIYDDKVNYPFDGKIEFLRIFGGIALSASEHKAWHNALA